MSKQIIFDNKARELLKNGVDKVANAVRVTVGPRGRNVVLAKSYGGPTITNDGVSIAKEIKLSDNIEDMGAEIMKEVASKTNDLAGDGTTTSVILAQAIIDEGMKQISMGANAMGVKLGIDKASEDVVEALKKMAKPIKTPKEIEQVASISAESKEIGEIIAKTIEKVGKDGVVTVEESQSFGVSSDVVEGFEFDKGYLSPYMVTNPERMEAEYVGAPILVTNNKISSIKELLPLLEKLANAGKKDLVIICEDLDGDALATLVVNKLRGAFNVLAIKAPGYGDGKKEILSDIAVMVGASVVSEDLGIKLDSVEPKMLGSAKKVISKKDSTVIIGGKGSKVEFTKKIEQIRAQIKSTQSNFDREKLEERLARLSGGVAVIKVGASTETEMKYLKLKIEDAVNATKAAIEEGIVPGGGTALVKVSEIVSKVGVKNPFKSFEKEFEVGVNIVLKSLEKPLKQIAMNAGKDDGSVIVDKVKNSKGFAGYDAVEDKIVDDMFLAGIVDPVKVTRSGVQNATSASAILLTTEVAIADEESEKEDGGMSGSGVMPGMM